MFKRINPVFFAAISAVALLTVSCSKTFDINAVNPNVPSSVDPKFSLSSSLAATAALAVGNPGGGSTSGNDLFNLYMGYWAVSGDYIPNASLVQYKLTTDFGSSIWDNSYPVLQNLKSIETHYDGAANGANYTAMSRIIRAFLFQRLVDIYNNIPYSKANNGGIDNFPAYDAADAIYKSLIDDLDASVAMINSAPGTADNPGSYDILFGGNMTKWKTFAKTLKLKMLMHLTQTSGGPAYITSKLAGMTAADFIGANADAAINPGYANDANNHQNPLWQDIGSTTTGTTYGSNSYFRATIYAVNFYSTTSDPRLGLFYSPNNSGLYKGRAFGSTLLEHNSDISGIGGPSKGVTASAVGLLKSPSQSAVILSSTESLFLQAEAVQRGYMGGSAAALYQSAVTESFRLLGVANAAAAATTYTAQAGDNTNFAGSTNPIKTIIVQKWAALNTYDPLESWSDWRRLGYPSDIPVSVYPGSTATHIPYRLPYPTSEYSYNAANVNGQGNIDALTSKIFWMP